MQDTRVWSLGWEDPLEKEVETHSRILAWRIPWTEEPGGQQSMELQRTGHDWVANTFPASVSSYYRDPCFHGGGGRVAIFSPGTQLVSSQWSHYKNDLRVILLEGIWKRLGREAGSGCQVGNTPEVNITLYISHLLYSGCPSCPSLLAPGGCSENSLVISCKSNIFFPIVIWN